LSSTLFEQYTFGQQLSSAALRSVEQYIFALAFIPDVHCFAAMYAATTLMTPWI
jgi:hypothetical protein